MTELRYDTPATLAARGIRIDPGWLWPRPTAYDQPRAFPGGFVPDPP
ncbi:hypothetical protein H1235_02950 [Pseudoxanthomonas sp. NC8]|nr:hypothetical protein H1235_02950 [Pseudoxanthomonas sp. NC8]